MTKFQTKDKCEISIKYLLTTNYRLHYIFVIIPLCNITKFTARFNAKFPELFNSLIIFAWFITTHQYDCSLFSQALSQSITYPNKKLKNRSETILLCSTSWVFYRGMHQCICRFMINNLEELIKKADYFNRKVPRSKFNLERLKDRFCHRDTKNCLNLNMHLDGGVRGAVCFPK